MGTTLMKTINTYINEKLQLTSKQKYTCQPKSKKELQDIILQRIKDEGRDCDLNDIDVSKITYMHRLFDADVNNIFALFNGDISQWDVSNVEDMNAMFDGCTAFNCDISKWDVSNVKNMSLMFHDCTIFNANLSKWNVSNVTNMYGMFDGCTEFKQDISGWDVSNVENMNGMFLGCESFKCDLSRWDVSNVKYMWLTFMNCPIKPDWYVRNHKK